MRGNNLFGIQADPAWKGPTVDVPTHEVVQGVRIAITDKVPRAPELVSQHPGPSRILPAEPALRPLLRREDRAGWARAVAAASYATAPNYAATLIAVMNGRNLQQYDALPAEVTS